MNNWQQIQIVGEVMWRMAVIFWPLVVLLVILQVGVWVSVWANNRNRLLAMRKEMDAMCPVCRVSKKAQGSSYCSSCNALNSRL